MTTERQVTPTLLQTTKGDPTGKQIKIERDAEVIGREPDCDIVLDFPGVSRHHARILRRPEGFFVEDLNSHNRTYLNGERLKKFTPTPLRDGNKVRICDFVFEFHCPVVTVEGREDDSSLILRSIDLSSRDRLETFEVKPEEKLRALIKIIRDLGFTLNRKEVLERTLETLFKIFPQADRGFVLLKEAEAVDLVPEAIKYRRGDLGQLKISQTIFDQVMRDGRAILSEDVANDSRFNKIPSVNDTPTPIRTMMCVPLMDQERRPVGILQIDTCDRRSKFSDEDLDLLAAVAGPIGVAVENVRLHDTLVRRMQVEQERADAWEVQQSFLPDAKPKVPGYEFWHIYEPAQKVGGDYFDYIPVTHPGADVAALPSRLAVVVGDVSGKGMPAALLMAKLASEVRLFLMAEADPTRVVQRLNHQFCAARIADRFVTFLLTLIDVEDHRLTFVSAGHLLPLIRRAGGPIETFGPDGSGTPLAIDRECVYKAVTTTIGPGDVVVLYTDGVNEAMNSDDRLFGLDRLKKTVRSAPARAGAVGEAILKAVRRHAAACPPSDDLTLLCIGREK